MPLTNSCHRLVVCSAVGERLEMKLSGQQRFGVTGGGAVGERCCRSFGRDMASLNFNFHMPTVQSCVLKLGR